MRDAEVICAILKFRGATPRSDLPELLDHATRVDVEQRLRAIGYELVDDIYADHYGTRVHTELTHLPEFDTATNLRLHGDALAMLTLLWAKLALPEREKHHAHQPEGQTYLVEETQEEAIRRNRPTVHEETIYAEFRHLLGEREQQGRLITQLARLRFVERVGGGLIAPGPLLEIAIDGDRMMDFLREHTILNEAVRRAQGLPEGTSVEDPAKKILALLEARGPLLEEVIQQALDMEAKVVRSLLNRLKGERRVVASGKRNPTYDLAPSLRTGPPNEPEEE
jgi:hypothetical protein